MMKRNLFFCLLIASIVFSEAHAQLVVSNSAPYNSVNYLVQNVLLGSGVQVSNITYAGAPAAIGYFNGLSSNLNLDSGIVLTSGDIFTAVGPNNNGGATVANGTPGDLQLEQLTNNTANGSFDAAVLEFDFTVNADTVRFEYVFGSEEYMEFVNTSFNDAFAFIISGVSVPLPATNIALIPSPPAPPNTPVTINNVNLGSYPQYYFDNENPPGTSVQYDGFTVVLQVIYPVQCGETYHIKLVVADVGDQILDSGVFLRAGSFSSSGNVTVSSNVSYGNLNDSTLYEGCGQACIVIDRGQGNLAVTDTVVLGFNGTALNGIDITQLPDTVFFAPGQDSVTICINGITDTLTEGSETLTLLAVLLGNTACSSGDTAVLTLYIDDHIPLSLVTAGDTSICFGSSVTISANASGGVPPVIYNWSPATGLSNTTIANPVAAPSVTTTYYVNITDSCSAPLQTDSVTIIVNPLPFANAGADASICQNGSTTLCASGTGSYLWMPLSQTTTCITVSSASAPTYTLTVTDTNGCTANDLVNVVITPMPSVAAGPSQTLCLGDSVQLTANATPPSGVTYSWVPSNGLSCTTCPNPWTSVTFSNTYTVYVSSGAGCTASGTVAVTVGSIPFVSAIAPSTICNGDSAQLFANTSNGTGPYSYYWSPPNDLNNPALQNPTSGPANSTSYTVVVTDANGCTDDTTTFLSVETVPSVTWASWTPDLTCDGYVIPLKANVSSNGNQVIWNFGDGTAPLVTYAPNTDAGPHSYPFNGTYTLTVVVFNVMCTDTVDTTLVISDMSGFLSLVPANVFTPNNDGMNDCFHPAFIPAPNSNLSPDTLESLQECLEMEVWDRWGIKMFESAASKKCWDGTNLKGKNAMDGTYYYIATFGEIKLPGYVTLLRKK